MLRGNDYMLPAACQVMSVAESATLFALLKERPLSFDVNACRGVDINGTLSSHNHGTLMEFFTRYASDEMWAEHGAEFARLFVACGGQINKVGNNSGLGSPLSMVCARGRAYKEGTYRPDCIGGPYGYSSCLMAKALLDNGARPDDDILLFSLENDHNECARRMVMTGIKFGPLKGIPADHWIRCLLTDLANTRRSLVTVLGCRTFRQCRLLRLMPRDVLLLIVGMVWQMRFQTETWEG